MKATLGGVASTWKLRVVTRSFPAWSSTRPMAVWTPLVANVTGAVSVEATTPVPGVASASGVSPFAAKVTTTLDLYQPPPPACSGARSPLIVSAFGSVPSTL